jgi:osmotically-inducible protein OsmY
MGLMKALARSVENRCNHNPEDKPMSTMFHKTDADIKKQIQEELEWDCRTEGSPITIKVVEGEVTLSRKVKNFAIKCAAEEATHRIAGVVLVKNNIEVRIPFGEWKTDFEIAEAAARTFAWDVLIPHKQVGAVVTGGWVELVGEVDCWSQREEVERAVIRLCGVQGVTNNIRVNAAVVESRIVQQAIHATLERHSPLEAQHIQIEMDENIVRLSGQVPTWGERCEVMKAAGFAPGVRQVVDKLVVTADA